MRSDSPGMPSTHRPTSHSTETWTVTEPGEGVDLVTLDRERSANTISTQVSTELCELVRSFDASPDVRAVVLTGRGRFFCAGADLRDPALGTSSSVELGRRALDTVAQLRVPVIAAVNGPALGGGTELALACDIRLAADGAVLGLPEVKIGALPGAGGLTRLQHLVGPSQARRLIFSGAQIGAAEAWRIGLVDEVVSSDELLATAISLAAVMADFAPYALATAKQVLCQALGGPPGQSLAFEYEAIDRMATTEQMQQQRERAARRDPAYARIFKTSEG